MKLKQEPKYKIVGDNLVNRTSDEVIPDDEPVFIFRARDVHAVSVLVHYWAIIGDEKHQKAVYDRVRDFRKFLHDHPERMKEPDT